jgi:hypothetical protein
VRGEGGLLSPALVLPLSVEPEPQPAERRLAVTEVRAELTMARIAGALGVGRSTLFVQLDLAAERQQLEQMA